MVLTSTIPKANVFKDNQVTGNTGNGIELDSSNNNNFEGNSANGNGRNGISLDFSVENVFEMNTANDNRVRGFQVESGSNDNTFIANEACNNLAVDFNLVEFVQVDNVPRLNVIRNWFIDNTFCKTNPEVISEVRVHIERPRQGD